MHSGYGEEDLSQPISNEESSPDNEGLVSSTSMKQRRRIEMTDRDRSKDSGDDEKRNNGDDEEEEKTEGTQPTPHASICGKHPAIRFYRRHIVSKNNTDGNGDKIVRV